MKYIAVSIVLSLFLNTVCFVDAGHCCWCRTKDVVGLDPFVITSIDTDNDGSYDISDGEIGIYLHTKKIPTSDKKTGLKD